jgi:hypothetical protein
VLTFVVKLPNIVVTGWKLGAGSFARFQVLAAVVLLGCDAMFLGE